MRSCARPSARLRRYARDLIMGRLPMPERGVMEEQHAKWRAAELAIEATDEANIRRVSLRLDVS